MAKIQFTEKELGTLMNILERRTVDLSDRLKALPAGPVMIQFTESDRIKNGIDLCHVLRAKAQAMINQIREGRLNGK